MLDSTKRDEVGWQQKFISAGRLVPNALQRYENKSYIGNTTRRGMEKTASCCARSGKQAAQAQYRTKTRYANAPELPLTRSAVIPNLKLEWLLGFAAVGADNVFTNHGIICKVLQRNLYDIQVCMCELIFNNKR